MFDAEDFKLNSFDGGETASFTQSGAESTSGENDLDATRVAPAGEQAENEQPAYVVLTPAGKPDAKSQNPHDKDGDSKKGKHKKSLPKRIARYLLPCKGDKLVEIVRKIIFLAAVIALIVSSCYIGDYFIKKLNNDNLLTSERSLYDSSLSGFDPKTGIYNRFKKLYNQNKDCVGWLSIPNTKTNNPVYKTTDNDFYLTHNALKEKSVYGSLFCDYRDIITRIGNSKNVTIYGHHMKDGTMLAQLHNYKDITFYKDNPTVTFDTIYGTGGEYKVFACMITNSKSEDDNGYFFDFAVPSFKSDSDFLKWIEQIRRRSLYVTPVDVKASDEIITMSTCTYEIKGKNLLCVVAARKVRSGESTSVNTTEAYKNSKIIYPAAWYQRFGGSKPTYDDGLYTWVSGSYDRESINAQEDVSSIDTISVGEASSAESSQAESSEAASSDAASSQETSAQPAASDDSSGSDSGSADSNSAENPGSGGNDSGGASQ